MVTDRTVAVVVPYYAPRIGGVERYAERIARELRDDQGLRPVVITSAPRGGGSIEVRNGIDVVRLPCWFTVSNTPVNPLWLWTVRRVLRRYAVDVVSAHAPVPGLPDIAVVAGGRPVALTYHSGSMVKHTGRIDILIRAYEKHVLPRLFRRADVLIAASRTSLAHRVPGSQTVTPGVDIDEFVPAGEPWGSTLLYVGRVDRASAWKGVDILLRAFAVVVAERPEARLQIVGSGDALDDHRTLARDLGIAEMVEFTGGLADRDLLRAYQQARALVLPSRTESESFGMTLIEAMACGRPVIGSDVGGIPSVVEDGRTGLLVSPGDPLSLASACLRVLGDDALCAEFGHNGRRHVERHYAWSLLARRHVQLVRDLASGTGGGRQFADSPSSPSVDRNES